MGLSWWQSASDSKGHPWSVYHSSQTTIGVYIRSVTETYGPALLRLVMGVATLLGAVVLISPSTSAATAKASRAIPTCSSRQLRMSTDDGNGAYSAAGNQGVAFIFHNVSDKTCSLEGYPKFRFVPSSFRGRIIKITRNHGSQIFATVPPRLVVIGAGAATSFGLGYGDAYNQSPVYSHASCTTRVATVWLPVQPHPYAVPYSAVVRINFCFAGFHFGVSSLQRGRVPKQG